MVIMSDSIIDVVESQFEGLVRYGSSSSTNSDVLLQESDDQILSVEKIANANKIDIILLKSAFADALNRLCSVEAELKQVKANAAKDKKDDNTLRVRDATSPCRGRTASRAATSPNRMPRAKSMSNLADVGQCSTSADKQQPAKTRRRSRLSESEKDVISQSNKKEESNRKNAPSSSAKKRFWSTSGPEDNNTNSKSSNKEVDKETKENGKPKIILAKKMSTVTRKYSRVSSLNDDASSKTIKEDLVKFNTRGRAMTLYPPSDYQEDMSDGFAPEQKLKLEWVYGYRGMDCRNNLHYVSSGELVYNMAGVLVLHDVKAEIQRHYTQHTDDVKCVAIHPNMKIAASGQVAGHGEDRKPHVQIWDISTLQALTSFGHGTFERGLCAVEFSGYEGGKYLIAFDESNDHVIYVYDWEKGTKMTETKASKEHLFGVKWNPSSKLAFASYGKSHLMFWTLCVEQKGMHLTKKAAIYENINKPKYVLAIAYTTNGDLVSGDSTGNILLFKDENNRNRVSESALSAHKGGVFCLCFLTAKETILSSGKDGQFIMWSTDLVKVAEFSKIPEQYGPARIILCNDEDETFIVGTAKNCILQYDSELSKESVLVLGHFDEMWGTAAHTTKALFASCAHEQLVCIWNCETKKNIWSYYIEEKAHCVEFHPSEDYLLVGTRSGTIYFLNYMTREEEITIEVSRDMISDIKVSPSGREFAVGCRDKNIYLYVWPDDVTAIKKPKVLQAHTSKVTHIDWSSDSEYLQSNSSDSELLYWSAEAGLQILSPSELRDVSWATWTCPYGFPTMGIWPEGEADINACSRSYDEKLIATGDTYGEVKIFRYPCTRFRSDNNVGVGHSSHVTCVRFLANDYGLVSVGGKDCSIMQWHLE